MTTREEISQWFDEGKQKGATHMLIVCDTFDWSNYPVFAKDPREALLFFKQNNKKNMQKVMEVYDLSLPKIKQLHEHRAMHLPAEPPQAKEMKE